jgi:hypothetical protein
VGAALCDKGISHWSANLCMLARMGAAYAVLLGIGLVICGWCLAIGVASAISVWIERHRDRNAERVRAWSKDKELLDAQNRDKLP